ncbi:MAG TPA: lysylphosphatidylglycerol synthase transmembrane domain-containing protein [Candidatus Acidoferrum sp.]|nr:lysylphosphatidylglycerol synthase transmembrane domain-containing protein [Candidatus Acidoferrum sp.]
MSGAMEPPRGLKALHRSWVSLLVGVAFSAGLAYLAVRTVRWSEVLQAFRQVEYRYLVLAALGVAVMHGLRALRIVVILHPVRRIRLWPAFCYTSIGFLAILVVPFRIGELARPLLLAEHEDVPFATGLAVVAVERCLDGLVFSGLIALLTHWLPLPGWAASLGYLMGVGYLIFLALLIWAWLRRESCVPLITRIGQWLRPTTGHVIGEAFGRFLDGLAFLPDSRAVRVTVLLSIVLWLTGICVNYVSFFALGLGLSVMAAAVLQILITVGVLLPTVPGALGSFQFFTVMGLELFGVGGALALTYAIVVHAMVLIANVLLGLVCSFTLRATWWSRLWALAAAQGNADTTEGRGP